MDSRAVMPENPWYDHRVDGKLVYHDTLETDVKKFSVVVLPVRRQMIHAMMACWNARLLRVLFFGLPGACCGLALWSCMHTL